MYLDEREFALVGVHTKYLYTVSLKCLAEFVISICSITLANVSHNFPIMEDCK